MASDTLSLLDPQRVSVHLTVLVLGICAALGAASPTPAAGEGASGDAGTQAGSRTAPDASACARFLRSLYVPEMRLVREYPGSKVLWLSHDGLLVERALRKRDPRLARPLAKRLKESGRAEAWKLAPILTDAPWTPVFREPSLLDVTQERGFTIKTEEEKGALAQGWEGFTDLCLFAAAGLATTDRPEALRLHRKAFSTWDGTGFLDPPAKSLGRYAAFKLALALLVGHKLGVTAPEEPRMLGILASLQTPEGGIVTDYDNQLKPIGVPNAETTSIVLIALDARGDRPNRGAGDAESEEPKEAIVAGSGSFVGALEELWRALKDNYPAMELVGAAGDAWLEEYRPRVAAAGSAGDAYSLMDELVCRLSDYHTRLTWPDMPPTAGPPVEVLVVPQKRPAAPASVARELQLRGLTPVPVEMPPLRDELVAVSRVEGVPGLRPGDLVATLNGVPVEQALASAWRHSRGSSRRARLREACWRMLLGAPSSELRMGVRRGSSGEREVRVRRDGFLSQPNVSVTEASGIPVVRIRGWGDSPGKPLAAEVDAILERYRDSRGIVFDVRGNGGGDDGLADQVTGRFLSHPVVSSVSFHRKVPSLDYERTTEWAKPRGPWRFEGRVAVLTDEGCRSACEHFVSGMAEAGALLCGSSTDGACGWIRPVELSGGARLYVSRTLPLHTGGVPSPMLGIAPHLWLPPTLPDLRAGRDAALTSAMDWVRSDAPLPARPLARYDGE